MTMVALIDYTGFGMGPEYAARLLAFTKSTRLNMSPDALDDFMNVKPWREIEEEISYMVTTLPSSWEFVSLTFLVSNVSRACAQQITRTRTASYAMQAQRVVDVRNSGYHIPEKLSGDARTQFCNIMDDAIGNYAYLMDRDLAPEDAREVLPMGIHCNLVVKHNLRSLVDTVAKRRSLRVQSEYRGVAQAMKDRTIEAWPWAAPFFVHKRDAALEMIEAVAAALPKEEKIKLAKAVDLIRTED
jgi:flavin-dependent thymidylate synthase